MNFETIERYIIKAITVLSLIAVGIGLLLLKYWGLVKLWQIVTQ